MRYASDFRRFFHPKSRRLIRFQKYWNHNRHGSGKKGTIMAFGPIMRLDAGRLSIELAPLSRDVLGEFVNPGMQQHGVMKYLGNGVKVLEDEQEWYEKVRTSKDSITWAIWLVNPGERTVIGTTSLFEIERDVLPQATSGSMIFRKEYWGMGIASAIHKARTWYAFQQMDLVRIKSAVLHGNVASRKALEKSGYDLVSIERNTHFVDGALRHQDNLACLNPNKIAWRRWWGDETPPQHALDARTRTKYAMNWASKNVTLP